MKRVLIISPNFPPVNAADMHRVRQSLPYFRQLGWEPVVIMVEERYNNTYSIDPLLLQTIPADIEVHKVGALPEKYTRKVGLGSLGMRSYFSFRKKGNELLKARHFDLVYFSTTMFHVMALGPGWKKRFGVPFVLDIQDPWRNDFYLDKPAAERPPKFFIAYNIDKLLERYTVPKAAGIISVSQGYNDVFRQRYPMMREDRFRVIPFGANSEDFAVMKQHVKRLIVPLSAEKINVIYVGRGGHDMQFACEIIFRAFRKGLETDPSRFANLHFWFVGTSYAPPGQGGKTIEPVAGKYGAGDHVTEITDRIPYFDTLFLLRNADLLLVPGSTDTSYTASKIYPYVLAGKPLLAVFHRKSSVVEMLARLQFGKVVAFDNGETADVYVEVCLAAMKLMLEQREKGESAEVKMDLFGIYTARSRTAEQTSFFDRLLQA